MEQTLLLNVTFEPIKVVSWQRAMTLWAQKKVEVVSEYDTEYRSVSFTFKVPSVVRLLRYVRVRRSPLVVPFTRANIYGRDNYTCQYCGEAFKSIDLTFDHVIPESQGGRKGWENIVTACVPCNREKGARTPEAAGMTLLRVPKRPTAVSEVLRVTVGIKRTPESWRDFLYWNVELDDGDDTV